MNKEGLNGATVIAPRPMTCWPALLTAGDCALKKGRTLETNLIALIPDAASLEENSVSEYELI